MDVSIAVRLALSLAFSVALSRAPATAQPAAGSACMAKAVSTVGIQNCQQTALTAANAELNATYREKMASRPAARRTALRREERAWIAERDRACAVKPDSGTSGPVGAGDCVLNQTRARTRALRTMH